MVTTLDWSLRCGPIPLLLDGAAGAAGSWPCVAAWGHRARWLRRQSAAIRAPEQPRNVR